MKKINLFVVCFIVGRIWIFAAKFYVDIMNVVFNQILIFDLSVICTSIRRNLIFENRFYRFFSLSFKKMDSINFALTLWTFRNGVFSEEFDDALFVKDVLAYQFDRILMSFDRLKKTYSAVTGDAFA